MTGSLASDEVPALCGRVHKACRRKKNGTGPEYDLFAAASEGCLMCVRYYVEVEGVAHNTESQNNKYTALDFAEWSQEDADTRAVQEYLRQKGEYGTGDVTVT